MPEEAITYRVIITGIDDDEIRGNYLDENGQQVVLHIHNVQENIFNIEKNLI